MDYAEYRAERASQETNADRHDFSWEQEHIPLLHSGFLQSLPGDVTKSCLRLTFFYSKGSYHCLLMDKETREKAFLNVETLGEGLAAVEEALRNSTLDWVQDEYDRNGKPVR